MKENRISRFTFMVTALLTLLPLFIGLLLYNRLPDQIPTHFSLDGQVDQYSSKNFTVFFMGLFLFALYLLCIFVTMHDPKIKNVSSKIISLTLWICPLIGLYISFIIYGKALNLEIDITRISMLLIGFIFVVIGNYLPKTRQNYTIGIKCAWTLNDKENWEKTHRFSGYLFVCAGIVVLLSVFLPGSYTMYILFGILLVIGILPFLYSYLFYKRKSSTEES